MTKWMNSLSGWARLWLVLSLIWVLCVVIISSGSFPTSREVTVKVGSSYNFVVDDVPLLLSRQKFEKSAAEHINEEREYAALIDNMWASNITASEFDRRVKEFDRRSKSFHFKPEVGWTTNSVAPPGKIIVSKMPREALIDWLTSLVVISLSAPIITFAFFLSFRWVKVGFAETKKAKD